MIKITCNFKSIKFRGFLSNILFIYFLCQLTDKSADIMSSLCGMGVDVRVHMSDFSSKTTRTRDMLFSLKIAYLLRMKNCSRQTDQFVCLFPRAIISKVPPTLSMKISTLYHNFLIHYCRDVSHILHIYTRPQVDSPV